jgi:methyl-accepting chemotaxis protein
MRITLSFLQNTKIRTKVLTLLIALSLIAVASIGFLSAEFNKTDREYSNFIRHDLQSATTVARATRNLQSIAYRAYQILQYPQGSAESVAALESYRSNAQQMQDRFRQTITLLPGAERELSAFLRDGDAIIAATEAAIASALAGRKLQAEGLLVAADPMIDTLTTELRLWNEEMSANVANQTVQLQDKNRQTIVTTLSALAVIILAAIGLSILVSARGITSPIGRLNDRMRALADGESETAVPGLGRRDEIGAMAEAVEVFRLAAIEKLRLEREADEARGLSERERLDREAQKARQAKEIQTAVDALAGGLGRLAEGDLSARIDDTFAGELDKLRTNFNMSAEKLSAAMQSVGENARAIHAGSEEIRSAADDLSKRTEQQAASVEETAAALEQITTTVADSTKRAEEASQLVGRTKAGAERSGEVVRKAVAAMSEIEKSSVEIGNIISLIDDIAFQTNLLALNAGVEAARAGDAGKGFAVVAQEVRELAQRSASAAREINALITSSGEQVKSGVSLVGQTGQALEVIVAEVQEINSHVAAIAESAREQAIGLKEINTAVNTMDQGTQQNAAMVEENNAASAMLAGETARLKQLVHQFRLGDAEMREYGGREAA